MVNVAHGRRRALFPRQKDFSDKRRNKIIKVHTA
jgi:hypothetical protein